MNLCKIIPFPKITDDRGNLTFIQNPEIIPFRIQRVFWMYDVPGGEMRGGHAYKRQYEITIALSGSFDINVINSEGVKTTYFLNRSYFGLYLPPSHWREIVNFSTNSVSLHIADTDFDPKDYIRDFNEFLEL